MGAAWKDILRQMCEKRKRGEEKKEGVIYSTTGEVAAVAGCSPQAARTVLERCRLYGTIRRDGKRGAAWLYEATDGGLKYIAGLDEKSKEKEKEKEKEKKGKEKKGKKKHLPLRR